MLERISIRNLAVIEFTEVEFGSGLNILSGETGSGKSVLLDAISLLLGSRASTDLIRFGATEAVVEGEFVLDQLPSVSERLERAGLPKSSDPETQRLLIKRTVHGGGKHRLTINGESATLGVLQSICEGLVDLCSQHEHQSLIKAAVQLDLLDRYGSLEKQRGEFSEQFGTWQELKSALADCLATQTEGSRKRDFLEYQIREIQDAQLTSDEESRLTEQKQLLNSGHARASAVRDALSAVQGSGGGDHTENAALASVQVALQKLRATQNLDPGLTLLIQGLERAAIELEDTAIALERYASQIEINPELLEQVTERLVLISDLKRKYGADITEVLGHLERLCGERDAIEHSDERRKSIEAELVVIEKKLRTHAEKLSAGRHKAAQLLARSVTAELQELQMKDALFAVKVTPTELGQSGVDAVQFEVRTNLGDQLRPLGRVASGGELSRLMLAIRRVIADRGVIGVYLFDEIDTGMGGKTAFQVGRKLRSVAQFNQVICITHLPQVAAFAQHHWSVHKTTRKELTFTHVNPLSVKERKEELARMLAGAEPTAKSLANAAELLELAHSAH